MHRTITGPPRGFRDLLFGEAETRRRIEGQFAPVFAARGYREIIPSSVETMDVYTRGHQGVGKRTFRFLDRDDNLLALRGDFTPSVARIVAGRPSDFSFPVKAWYSGSVFRKADRNRGLFQEFCQVGAECIGVGTLTQDAELVDIALQGLTRSGVQDACVHVNHAGIFRGIVDALGLDEAARAKVKSTIDRKDMRALGTKLAELGIGAGQRLQVDALARCVGDAGVLETAAAALNNRESDSALGELATLAVLLSDWRERVVFDLTEIDEMEYYTGCMFTFFSPSHSGELGKGGRYDGLLREFGKDLPAVGFSLSVDRISECL
jgi:ATP phosphoribosyltransferase regulatory subunit